MKRLLVLISLLLVAACDPADLRVDLQQQGNKGDFQYFYMENFTFAENNNTIEGYRGGYDGTPENTAWCEQVYNASERRWREAYRGPGKNIGVGGAPGEDCVSILEEGGYTADIHGAMQAIEEGYVPATVVYEE